MKIDKLIYIEYYFKISGESYGTLKTSYVHFEGSSTLGVNPEDFEYTKLKVVEHVKASLSHFEGDISIESCTKEEYQSQKSLDVKAPIGYLKLFQKIDMKKDENHYFAISSLDCDFNNFFSEEIWDILAGGAKNIYEKAGYTEVSISPATEKQYQAYMESNSEILVEKRWNESE